MKDAMIRRILRKFNKMFIIWCRCYLYICIDGGIISHHEYKYTSNISKYTSKNLKLCQINIFQKSTPVTTMKSVHLNIIMLKSIGFMWEYLLLEYKSVYLWCSSVIDRFKLEKTSPGCNMGFVSITSLFHLIIISRQKMALKWQED